jgi:DeoR family transcriptional regulator, fructose operon transcriptional repressor
MLADERRYRIRELLNSQRSVTAAYLESVLGVTAVTIRRDLAALEKEGVLVRSHGGAVSRTSSTAFQPSYDTLLRTNCEEKAAIARAAELLLTEGETVFFEGSTTVFELARTLHNFNRLTVVTNSPSIVCQLQRLTGVNVLCTGGDLQRDQLYFSGLWAQQALAEIHVDKVLLGVTAIDALRGYSCASQAEAQIKKMLVKAARKRIALVDHSKFGNQAFVHLGPVTDFDTIITDSATDPGQIESLREAGVEVIVVDTAAKSPAPKPSA